MERLESNCQIIEVCYPDWQANVVVVRKNNGIPRVCLDFIDLNKVYPKDSFLFSMIDTLVDAIAGLKLISFLKTYSSYNQILMHPGDQNKTSFMAERVIYCHKMMPLRLKIAGATYQRLVKKMYREQIDKTMEVYIDNKLRRLSGALKANVQHKKGKK